MTGIKGKNIIVTGASGGIGNSIVEKLNQAGANILASGTRMEKLDELKSKYVNIKTLKFDISQRDQIEQFVENATKELGGNLDCIVNNAGITQDNLAIRMSLEEWQKVIDINLTSTFLMSKSAIKKCLKINLERLLILHQLLVIQEILDRLIILHQKQVLLRCLRV